MASARLWRLSAPLGSSVVANPGAAVERPAIPCAMRRTASMLGPCARHWLRSPVAMAATYCRILLANPEISLYCPIIRFLVDQNKINNKACTAEVYGHSDVYFETCFFTNLIQKLFM